MLWQAGLGGTHGVVGLDEGVIAGNDVDVLVLDTALPVSRVFSHEAMATHALRKTIRPMRPKPLMPTLTTMFASCVVVLC